MASLVVECEVWDQRVTNLRLITVLCPCVRHFILCYVLVQTRKTVKCPDITKTKKKFVISKILTIDLACT